MHQTAQNKYSAETFNLKVIQLSQLNKSFHNHTIVITAFWTFVLYTITLLYIWTAGKLITTDITVDTVIKKYLINFNQPLFTYTVITEFVFFVVCFICTHFIQSPVCNHDSANSTIVCIMESEQLIRNGGIDFGSA
jgi:hypothetical protein